MTTKFGSPIGRCTRSCSTPALARIGATRSNAAFQVPKSVMGCSMCKVGIVVSLVVGGRGWWTPRALVASRAFSGVEGEDAGAVVPDVVAGGRDLSAVAHEDPETVVVGEVAADDGVCARA